MRILITIMILWSSTMAFGQEIWQLSPWAPDSSYVIGAMNSGEPTWVKVDSLGVTEYLDPYIISSDTVGFTHVLGTDTTTVIINNCAGESLSMSNLENLSDAGATQGNTINLTNVGINTSDPKFSLDVNGVDGIRVPCGTTAQRPYAPEKGVIRFNTSSNKFEGWNGTKWVKLSLF